MADFSEITQEINEQINTNGTRSITGAKLNTVLRDMIAAVNAEKQDPLTFDEIPTEDSPNPVESGGVYYWALNELIEDGGLYGGAVGPSDEPIQGDDGDDYRYFYIAYEKGRYVHFNNYEVDSVALLFFWTGKNWGYTPLWVTSQSLELSLSRRAQKPESFTEGNLAGLDAEGNLTDSGKKASYFATAAQGAKAETAYQKPQTGIPESDLSSDVQQALQKHFKGWYTSSSNLPANPVVGDYAYVEDSGTTYIYRCSTDGEWPETSTEEKDPVDVTFAGGEEVNETYIDDTHLANPKSGALPTANDALQLKAKLEGVTRTEIKINYVDGSLLTGHYVSTGGSTSGTSTSYDCATFDVGGYGKVRFLGVEMSSRTNKRGYAFYDSNGDYITDSYVNYDINSGGTLVAKEYIVAIPSNAKYFKTNIKVSTLVTSANFYCYVQSGDSVVDLIPDVVNNLNTGGATNALAAEQGKVLDTNTRSNAVVTYDDDSIYLTHGCYYGINGASGSSDSINLLLIPVSVGDKVKIYGVSPNHSTVRFWCFFNSGGSAITYADKDVGNFRQSGLELVVPENAVTLAVNYASYDDDTDFTTVTNRSLAGAELNLLSNEYHSEYQSTTYTSSNVTFEDGYLLLTIGNNASVAPSGTSSSKHGIIQVKKGQSVTIKLIWTGNGRGYYFTDNSFGREVLSSGESSQSIYNIVTTTAPSDGYLYINCEATRLDELKVIVTDTYASVANQYNVAISVTNQHNYINRYENAPIPRNKETLKVFGIGNSHMNNSTMYIKELLEAVSIDGTTLDTKVALYYVGIAAATIDTWVDASGTYTAYNRGGTDVFGSGNLTGTLDALLAYDWDIVVIQQYSGVATDITSYANLPKLVARIRQNCPNQNVCIAFNMTWGYKTNMNYLPNTNEAMWSMICTAVQKMVANYGVDVVIPTGTAIQNARQQSIASIMRSANDQDLTNDGTHLAPGVAKYVAASTWFQTLIAPAFGVSILGNPANHIIGDEPWAEGEGSVDDSTGVDVTDTNRFVCQQCAFFATMDKYSVWEIELE